MAEPQKEKECREGKGEEGRDGASKKRGWRVEVEVKEEYIEELEEKMRNWLREEVKKELSKEREKYEKKISKLEKESARKIKDLEEKWERRWIEEKAKEKTEEKKKEGNEKRGMTWKEVEEEERKKRLRVLVEETDIGKGANLKEEMEKMIKTGLGVWTNIKDAKVLRNNSGLMTIIVEVESEEIVEEILRARRRKGRRMKVIMDKDCWRERRGRGDWEGRRLRWEDEEKGRGEWWEVEEEQGRGDEEDERDGGDMGEGEGRLGEGVGRGRTYGRGRLGE